MGVTQLQTRHVGRHLRPNSRGSWSLRQILGVIPQILEHMVPGNGRITVVFHRQIFPEYVLRWF